MVLESTEKWLPPEGDIYQRNSWLDNNTGVELTIKIKWPFSLKKLGEGKGKGALAIFVCHEDQD